MRTERQTDRRKNRRTDGRTDERTQTTKLIVAFRNFARRLQTKVIPANQGKLYCLNFIQKITQHYAWKELYQGIQKINTLGTTHILHQVLG